MKQMSGDHLYMNVYAIKNIRIGMDINISQDFLLGEGGMSQIYDKMPQSLGGLGGVPLPRE